MSQTETIRLVRDKSTASAACWTSASAEVEVPAQLGSVRLIRELGRGGMGVVWLGHDDMLDRDVAVKFLLGAVTSKDDPDFARFLEGARAAAAIRHPGLTTIYQIDLVQGVPYLVMEYVNGPTLAQVLSRHGPLSVPQALAIMQKVCEPIAELHDRGIVHRDIKPGNIMLNAQGDVFVTDFGLACERVPTGSSIAVKGLAGTPTYMAPEMFDGTISPRSDVYALGAMLFELLVGRSPFDGTLTQLQHDHALTPVPTGVMSEKAVPEPLINLIERAMNKNPMFRLKTARQLQLSLETASRQERIRANSDGEVFALLTAFGKFPKMIADDRPPSEDSNSGGSESGTPTSSYFEQISTMADQRRQIASSAPPQVVRPPAEHNLTPGTVARDMPCAECGYNLRGATPSGLCPECGFVVLASLGEDRLDRESLAWLETLQRGITLLHRSVIAFPILVVSSVLCIVVASIVVTVAYGHPIHPIDAEKLSQRVATWWLDLTAAAGIAISALFTRAVWKATQARPEWRETPALRKARRRGRLWTIAFPWTMVLLLPISVHVSVAPPTPWQGAVLGIGMIIAIVIGLLSGCGLLLLCRYLAELARRIPDESLYGRVSWVYRAIFITYIPMQFLPIVTLVSAYSGIMAAVLGLMILWCVAFLVLTERCLWTYRKRLRALIAFLRNQNIDTPSLEASLTRESQAAE